MTGIERAPEREQPQPVERAAPPPLPPAAPPGASTSGRQGRDVYGCVDWFDYCPLPRTDPPVRRRS